MPSFDAARRAALIQDLLRIVRGQPVDLLPFEPIRRELKLHHLVDRGLREVPLERIVGSLDRTTEFNRAFLPRDEALRERWEGVLSSAEGPHGFPPVELYQVADVYFVVDGHHRISVERALGAPTIEARVKEFPTPVPLPSDATIDEVLLRRGLSEFLAATGLAEREPGDYRVTVPQGYERLIEHIRVHGYFRGLETGRDLPWGEEVASWRNRVYRPMVAAIRASGVLAEFPARTETDLYLFVMDHLHHLRQRYGDPDLPLEQAIDILDDLEAADAATEPLHPRQPSRPLRRAWERVVEHFAGAERGEASSTEADGATDSPDRSRGAERRTDSADADPSPGGEPEDL